MIIIIAMAIEFGVAIFFIKRSLENCAIATVVLGMTSIILLLYLAPKLIQYEDYSESYSLQQMDGGRYYSTYGDEINVMILDGNMQKQKSFKNHFNS